MHVDKIDSMESMTPRERLSAAIALEQPDRVPIAPLMSLSATASLLDLNAIELYDADADAQLAAVLQVFDKYGGWDALPGSALDTPDAYALAGLKVKLPDAHSTGLQVEETELMTAEDYDLVVDMGWTAFRLEHLVPRASGWTQTVVYDKLFGMLDFIRQADAALAQRGAEVILSGWGYHPFFQLSLARSMLKFTQDLYYTPDKVEHALRAMLPEFIETSIDLCKAGGKQVAGCTEERASGYFYPLEVFERFWWPYTLEIVDAHWSEGIVTWFHLDTSWDKNLPYFRQLPRGSAIIDLDGTTDIWAAKELLRDHHCIATDVHPALLSLGQPAEVTAYCQQLIDRVGAGGGMILSSGCSVPATVRSENFSAMIETGKTYELRNKQ